MEWKKEHYFSYLFQAKRECFSLNAIVDVRRLFSQYLGNYWSWQLQNLTQHSIQWSSHLTGIDVTSYFRSEANRIGPKHVQFVMFGSRFIHNGSTDSEQVYSFWNWGSRNFVLCNLIDIFSSLTTKDGGSSGPTVVHALRSWLIAIFTVYFHALHRWFVSYCCRGQLAHASRCTVMHERFRNKWQQIIYTAVAMGWVTSRFALPHPLVGLLV